MMISRSKHRSSVEVCSDCGASDPSWASINRGLLLCAECCSVHRSMGRHISHVKSLRQGSWPPSLLSMVQALTSQNVNSIWEHSLLDTSAPKHLRKKPQPKDPLHPLKSQFILAKHLRLAYVLRARRDEPATELGRQLHSAVRSFSLDTAMRLLAQGADPNYYNPEKGSACLHVACRAGQPAQAELLVTWGADPTTKDCAGNTPADSARQGGHAELADRMTELVYEATDRMIYFLTGDKPDHASGRHYIVPRAHDAHEMTDVAKAARGKLQLLPNHLFEELIMDIYDEIDRRETEAKNIDPKVEHSYSRKRHFDHTYCQMELEEPSDKIQKLTPTMQDPRIIQDSVMPMNIEEQPRSELLDAQLAVKVIPINEEMSKNVLLDDQPVQKVICVNKEEQFKSKLLDGQPVVKAVPVNIEEQSTSGLLDSALKIVIPVIIEEESEGGLLDSQPVVIAIAVNMEERLSSLLFDGQPEEKIWQTSATGLERCGVAFLPVNPALSAPRNQGRQKLARLSPPELRALLRDVLLDAARRQRLASLQPRGLSAPAHAQAPGGRLRQSQMSDDEPLYDSVASDDDYAALAPLDIDDLHQVSSMDPKTGETVSSTYNPSLPLEHSIDISFTPSHNSHEKKDEIETLKKELDTRDSTITELKNQLKSLQTIVEQLTKENSALKTTSSVDDDQSMASQNSMSDLSPPERGRSLDGEPAGPARPRPVSMFETREGPRNNWQVTKHQLTSIPGLERSLTQSVIEGGDEIAGASGAAGGSEEEVQRRAEAVTRCIQELWAAARLHRQKLPECGDAIQITVTALLALFPQTCSDSSLQQVLDELSDASDDVVSACAARAPIERVRAAAYELAKATKRLVTRPPPS